MRLIDADGLTANLLEKSFYPAIVKRVIENMPTIDPIRAVGNWINVKERPPIPGVPVLTYGRKGAYGIGFTQNNSCVNGKVYFYARYGDSLPTHWMPLPNPPREAP